MLVTRRMLERHLDWIGRRYRFVSLDELGARLEGRDRSRDAIAAVTFDDGYRDFYDHAYPVLMRKGIPAAVFVVTGLVGTKVVPVHDRLYLLLKRRFAAYRGEGGLARMLRDYGIPMPDVVPATPFEATRVLIEALPHATLEGIVKLLESTDGISEDTFRPFHALTWEMVERLDKSGMTIGSHTASHILMTNETRQRVMDEVTESRAELETRLGRQIRHFAYPSGQFNSAAVDAVAKAGYHFGYTVCRHRDILQPRLTVPRTLLWEKSCVDFRGSFSGPMLSCQMHRAFEVVSGCRQDHYISKGRGNAGK
jgi:peptidoglycan/xylan/chitin deacetylase (PgdA/CDA1 family)